jgi:exopolysaccharide biosynthesis polyprenyl glycosylphosphotransferase
LFLAMLVAGTALSTGMALLGSEIPGSPTLAHRLFIAKALLAWFAAILLFRLIYGIAISRASPYARRVMVIGNTQQTADIQARVRFGRGQKFELVVLRDQELTWQSLRKQKIWAVVLTSAADTTMIEPLLECKVRGMRILGSTAFQEDYLGRVDLNTVTISDLLLGQGFNSNQLSSAVKRFFDIVIAVCMLVLTLPLMALTALAIKADSPGPAIYRQQRIGQFDKPFVLFKFRSMTVDAEAGGSPRWAQKQDPRVTRIGRFIRATRIDELPQLVNVIRGEMSLVGPRPERGHFVKQLERAIPLYRQRAYVKPGLTGWAQVNFPYGASVEDAREKLSYDLFYVKHRSILLDAMILLLTVRVVLFREGAR